MNILLVDVDGTLIDSFPGIRASFLHALTEMNWPIPSEERISQIAGPPMIDTMLDLGMAPGQAQLALAHYLDHYGHTGWKMSSPFPGMHEFLNWARLQGFLLCTATSKGEFFAEQALREHGFWELFDFLGAAQEDGERRSKSAVIAHVLDTMQLRGQESAILMVGDRIHDIEGARSFGIETVAVAWGYGSESERKEAAFEAATPVELESIVDEWARQH
ncbi:HAD-IA family hydrolase [Corynebacterium sp. H128]|uniref:HAD-IA family hydrolase n=1 Tax=unclassified Corynebacterium TaxID=2624378 RepID=UPI0030AA87AC